MFTSQPSATPRKKAVHRPRPASLLTNLWTLSWIPIVIGALAFVLYGRAAAPGIVELFDDTLEFQVVGPTFGIAHPTGYPLYVLLSGLWSRLLFPFGEWAWRMNLFSALTGAAAVAVVATVGKRLAGTDDSRASLAGLGAALAFGLGPVWWNQATEAEVYTLHILLGALLLYLTLSVLQKTPPTGVSPDAISGAIPGAIQRMTGLCLIVGLGLAHHRTTVLFLPAVALVLLWQAPALLRPGRHWLRWTVVLLSPLLLYLFIPLRAAMGVQDLHGSYTNTWTGFWEHILARRYLEFFGDNPLAVERTPLEWWALFVEQMGLPVLALALVGLIAGPLILSKTRPGWLLITITLVINLLFAVSYRVYDVEVFLLPAFLCLALLAALGLGVVMIWVERGPVHLARRQPGQAAPRHHWRQLAHWRGMLAGLLLLVVIALGLGGRETVAARTHDWAAHDYAYLLASVDFPPHSRLIGLEGEVTALRYMQAANRLGQNATGIVANLPAQRQAAIAAGIEVGAPVFITREVEGIAEQYSFSGAGPLIRVWPPGQAVHAPLAQPVFPDAQAAPLVLDAAAWEIRHPPGGPLLELTFDWRLIEPTTQTYKLSLRLLRGTGDDPHTPLFDRQGEPIIADLFPMRQVALTHQWPVDEPLRDVHYLPLPAAGTSNIGSAAAGSVAAIPPGAQLLVILYDAESVQEAARWEFTITPPAP